MTRLPPAEDWYIHKMTETEVAEMIEAYIDYYEEDENGNRHSVHLPMPFVRHFMTRDDGALPITVAISTMPLVLADGNLLAPPGLDRLRGIQFIIPPELRAVIPRPQDCTPARVKAAMEFLCNEWLVDVATDGVGKSLVITAALTLIERSLMSERPCFFVTAGQRSSGKTTLLDMLIMAVLGLETRKSAWSPNEEERRKALMAQLVEGPAYILWDNIPRGLQIACPHIERACTTAFYSDRRLGSTEIATAAASSIQLFTGNNIGAKGDMSSRTLHIRLTADRADPENRDFRHPDPVSWTEDHRAEIMAALYTILLGNPQLKTARDAPGKTRFKMWWRLVGSAMERTIELMGGELDFKDLFVSQEEEDEESAAVADALDVLVRKWPGQFEAKELAAVVNVQVPDEDAKLLRDFLLPTPPPGYVFSPRSIGRHLKKHIDRVVDGGGCTLVLRSYADPHLKMRVYEVDVTSTV